MENSLSSYRDRGLTIWTDGGKEYEKTCYDIAPKISRSLTNYRCNFRHTRKVKYLKPWLFCFPIEVLKKRALILHKHECLGDIYNENGYKELGDMDVLKMISLKNNFLIDLIMSFSSLKINVQIFGGRIF